MMSIIMRYSINFHLHKKMKNTTPWVHTLLKCATHAYDYMLFAQNEHCSTKNNCVIFDLSPIP